ncbi:hypothetical protein G9A89_023495 [Geosiphon pyriformis]|nr:hypothetical protein G9A89_023495 [Geosiphon pyriformis]
MPPLPTTVTALPLAFISSILEGQGPFDSKLDGETVDNKQKKLERDLLLSSPPVDRTSIIDCIQRIDQKIFELKTQVFEKINSQRDTFATLDQKSGELCVQIDTLCSDIDSVSQRFYSPDLGTKQKLLVALRENQVIMQDMKNADMLVDILEYIREVQLCTKRFDDYLADFRIEEAAGTVREMDSLLDLSPIPGEKKIHILDRLKLKLASMRDKLDQTMDDLLTKAIIFDKIEGGDGGGRLTVSTMVQSPDSAIHLSSIFVSLTEVNLVDMQLSRLKKNVLRYLIIPLLGHRDSWSVEIKVENEIGASLMIGPSSHFEIGGMDDDDLLFSSLTRIFHFIYHWIFGGPDPSSPGFQSFTPSPLTTQYANKFGNLITSDLRDLIIKQYLAHVIPTEISELKWFDKVAQSALRFEADMRRLEFMSDLRDQEEEYTLATYVAKVDLHFTVRKRDRLLELGRRIMMDQGFETVVVIDEDREKGGIEGEETESSRDVKFERDDTHMEEKNETATRANNEGWDLDWNEDWGDDGWGIDEDQGNKYEGKKDDASKIGKDTHSEIHVFEPKRYEITTKSKALIQLTINVLHEARKLNAQSGNRLYNATLDLFDLYRAIMPVYHNSKFTDIPALSLIFYNDCFWLAAELNKIQETFYRESLTLSSNKDEDYENYFHGMGAKGSMAMDNGISSVNKWTGQNVSYEDMCVKLHELGQKWFNIQMEAQKSVLKEFLDDMGGVHQVAIDRRFESCHRAMKQIVYSLNQLSKVWKLLIPPVMHYTALGILIDFVIKRMIEDIEDLYDISAEESQQLNLICGMLFELEGLFPKSGANKIDSYVKNWEKYHHLTDILDLSLAEIINRFREAKLISFKTSELENLICALFADTPLRARYLGEIRAGHP